MSHRPFNVGNPSLFVYLHGCAVACASCATKQAFAQRIIFLEGTPPFSVLHRVASGIAHAQSPQFTTKTSAFSIVAGT